MRSRGLVVILISLAVIGVMAATVRAESTDAAAAGSFRCNGTTAGGQAWAIRQTNTNCHFARFAVRTAVDRRRSPKSWRCFIDKSGEFGPERRDYRVRCYHGGQRVLGLAR